MTIQPFKINVAQDILDDLKQRLAMTRWPDEIEGAGWDYGTNPGYLKELAAYWRDGFDWRAQEAALNEFPQFRAEIDGFGVHFIHVRGKGPNPKPLLLSHGWPDSFYRFYKLIPMLTDPARFGGDAADSFDVIVPSLPGFGFTDKPSKRGFGIGASAELLHRLMTAELGYSEYFAHGGDGGSAISQYLAINHPEAVKAIHLTDIGWGGGDWIDQSTLSEAEQGFLQQMNWWFFTEGAYAMMHMSKPQTLAYGLNDSPMGLAAWIVEKFRGWSDGEIEQVYTKDELLTNITIYWVTGTIFSSIRGYFEEAQNPSIEAGTKIGVPAGLALFPRDNPPPRELAERTLNVQRWTPMERGGHFGALEAPEGLANELRSFFRAYR